MKYLAITLLRRPLGVGKVCVRTSVAEAGPLKLSVLALDSENVQCSNKYMPQGSGPIDLTAKYSAGQNHQALLAPYQFTLGTLGGIDDS